MSNKANKAKEVSEVVRFEGTEQAEQVLTRALKGGAFVTIGYRGRTDGKIRRRLVRGGAVKPETLSGMGPNYDRESRFLVQVYDMTVHGYRVVPCEGLFMVKRGGTLYVRKES